MMDELWILLEKARYQAVKEHGISHLVDWKPTTEEEKHIWSKITSSENYENLAKHFTKHRDKMNPTALRTYQQALLESTEGANATAQIVQDC